MFYVNLGYSQENWKIGFLGKSLNKLSVEHPPIKLFEISQLNDLKLPYSDKLFYTV